MNSNKQHQNIESASTSEQPLQSSIASQVSKQHIDSNNNNKVQTNNTSPNQYFSLSGSQNNKNTTSYALDKLKDKIKCLQFTNYIISLGALLNSIANISCSVYLDDHDHIVRQLFGYIESSISIVLLIVLTFINVQNQKQLEMYYIIFSSIYSLSCFFFILYLELQKIISSDEEAQPIIDPNSKSWYHVNHVLTGLLITLPLFHLALTIVEAYIYKYQQKIRDDYLSDVYSNQAPHKLSYTNFIEQQQQNPIKQNLENARSSNQSNQNQQSINNNNTIQQSYKKKKSNATNPNTLILPIKNQGSMHTYNQTPRFMTLEHQFQLLRKTDNNDDTDLDKIEGQSQEFKRVKATTNSRKSDLIENISNTFQVQDKKLNHQELTSSLLHNAAAGTDNSPESPQKPYNNLSTNIDSSRYTQQMLTDGKKKKNKINSLRNKTGYSSQSQILVHHSVAENDLEYAEDNSSSMGSSDNDFNQNIPPGNNNGESYKQFIDMHYNSRKIQKNQINQIQGFQESDIY